MKLIPTYDVMPSMIRSGWYIEEPVESPIISGEFDYIRTSSADNLQEVVDKARKYLDYMEHTYQVTFKLRICKDSMTETYDIRNDEDMLTLILKYS
jgi:hypothetical protein